MTNIDNINIREIIARFQNSAEVIDELRARLESLTATDDLHSASLQSTQSAAQAIQELSTMMRQATDTLKVTLTTADSALRTATEFLQATDLSEVGKELKSVSSEQAALRKDQNEFKNEITSSLTRVNELISQQADALRRDLDAAKSETLDERNRANNATTEAARAEADLNALKTKIGSIPDRVRSKYGL